MATKKITPENEVFIRENYLTIPIRHIAKIIGISRTPIKNFMKRNGLVLPEEVKKQRQNHFQSGHIPMNKGKKGLYIPGSEKGWFQKGHKPHNTREDGDVSIRKDNSGREYVFIRLSDNNWVHEHRLVWIKHNGQIPEGYIIRHLNGNSLDNRIENLSMISKYENRVLNNEITRQSDEYIARMLATRNRKVDNELKAYFLQFPELLELKRNVFKLNKVCKTLEMPTN